MLLNFKNINRYDGQPQHGGHRQVNMAGIPQPAQAMQLLGTQQWAEVPQLSRSAHFFRLDILKYSFKNH